MPIIFSFLGISGLVTSSWLWIHNSRVEQMIRQDTNGRICDRLRKEKIWVPTSFSHPSITDSTEPQNALLRIVVQNQSFSQKPILVYLTGLITKSTEDPPPSTGLLGRPLSLRAHIHTRIHTCTHTPHFGHPQRVCVSLMCTFQVHTWICKFA